MTAGYRVVVPYTNLHPVTRDVLDSYGLPVEYASCIGDPENYRLLLQRLWKSGTTIVLVEHDIVPWPGAIEELAGCPGLWCSCSYAMNGGGPGVYHALGCTKISEALMWLLPNLWDAPCPWHECDQRLWFAARAIGQEPHGHRPPVVHLKVGTRRMAAQGDWKEQA